MESKTQNLLQLLCENFEGELKEAFKFCDSLKVPSYQYEGKIIWNRISNEISFSYDDRGHYILDSMFMITGNNVFVMMYLLAVLNSNLLNNWIKSNAATLGEGVYGAKIYIEKSPIPKITKSNQKIVDSIIILVDEILESRAKDATFDISKLESKINFLVYALYDLSDEEIKIIDYTSNC